MKHLINEKITKLTRRTLAFLLAMVLMTSAFVPGFTARATETTPTDPSVVMTEEFDSTEKSEFSADATEVMNTETVETPVCTGGDTCTIEGCTNHIPVCPGDDTCTIEGCANHVPVCPGDDTCTIEGCANHVPVCPGDDTCTIEGCANHVPVCPGDDTCTIENCTNHVTACIVCGEIHEGECVLSTVVSTQTLFSSMAQASGAVLKAPTFTKVAERRADGSYDLKLTISGAFAQETSPAKVDIVLIIDRSGSMVDNKVTINGKTMTRFANAIEAAKRLVAAMEDNENVSAQYNIVTFEGRIFESNGYKRAWNSVSGWKETGSAALQVINSIPNAVSGAATNYEAAFEELRDALPNSNKGRSDATKVVVFLTDGDPTLRTSNPDDTAAKRKDVNYASGCSHYYGSGRTDTVNVQRCLDAAKKEIANIKMDRFYAIGTGNVTSNNLTELGKAAKNAAYVQVKTTADANLTAIFDDIVKEITDFHCVNVTVTDTLKHEDGLLMVDIVNPEEVYVTVYSAGNQIARGKASVTLPATKNNKEATITAVYDSEVEALVLDFPDDYKLEEDYTYEISTVINPTEKAYREYREKMQYTSSGDKDTGTHSLHSGFRCNDKAVAEYSYLDKPVSSEYAYPVVQLSPGTLTVTKAFEGLNDAQIAAINDIAFEVKIVYPDDGNGIDDEIVTTTLTLDDLGDDYAYTFEGLSPGTAYTVTETGGELKDYNQTTSWTAPCEADCAENCTLHKGVVTAEENTAKTVSGIVDRSENVTVSYTNAYAIAATEITVEKQIVGNLGDWNKPFQFTASIGNGTMNGIQYVKYNADGQAEGEQTTITSESFTFTLKDDEYITFTNIPLNSTFTISENPENYSLLEVKASESKDLTREGNAAVLNVTGENKVTFTNELEASIETGVDLDSVPYVLILGAVAVCAFFFLRKRPVKE